MLWHRMVVTDFDKKPTKVREIRSFVSFPMNCYPFYENFCEPKCLAEIPGLLPRPVFVDVPVRLTYAGGSGSLALFTSRVRNFRSQFGTI